MQRACSPPAYYRTTNLTPSSSSSRQHDARVAGPRCALASCFCRSLRSITRPHHHHLSLPLLAARYVIVHHTTQHRCQCNSDNRQQQHSSQQCIPTSICCSLLSAWAHAPHAPRTCFCLLSMLPYCVIKYPAAAVCRHFFFFFFASYRSPCMYVQVHHFFSYNHRTFVSAIKSLLYQ